MTNIIKSSTFFIIVIHSVNAYSYLDLGTGSYIIQSILAGFFATVYFVKLYWFKIRAFFSKFSKKNKT